MWEGDCDNVGRGSISGKVGRVLASIMEEGGCTMWEGGCNDVGRGL